MNVRRPWPTFVFCRYTIYSSPPNIFHPTFWIFVYLGMFSNPWFSTRFHRYGSLPATVVKPIPLCEVESQSRRLVVRHPVEEMNFNNLTPFTLCSHLQQNDLLPYSREWEKHGNISKSLTSDRLCWHPVCSPPDPSRVLHTLEPTRVDQYLLRSHSINTANAGKINIDWGYQCCTFHCFHYWPNISFSLQWKYWKAGTN